MTGVIDCIVELWPVLAATVVTAVVGVAVLLKVVISILKGQIREHERLNSLLAQFEGYEQLDALLARGPRVAGDVVDATFVLLYVQDQPDGVLVLKTVWPDGVLTRVPEYVSEPLWPRPEIGSVFKASRCDLGLLDMAADDRLYSLLVAPVTAWHETVGYLVFGWRGRRVAEQVSRVCMAAGRYLGITLDRMWAHEALRVEADESRRLSQTQREGLHAVLHDIRQPLTLSSGYLELLLGGQMGEFDEATTRALRAARSGVDRAQELAEDLLSTELPERERIQIHPLDVADVIEELAVQMAGYAERQGVTIRVDVGGELPLARADQRLLYRVLVNLVMNAVRHTSAGGSIALRAWYNGDESAVTVEVADTGAGMAPEKLDELLSAPVDATPVNGRLGLQIVRRLLHQMSGCLRASSELGQGTTFAFDLVVPAWLAEAHQGSQEAVRV